MDETPTCLASLHALLRNLFVRNDHKPQKPLTTASLCSSSNQPPTLLLDQGNPLNIEDEAGGRKLLSDLPTDILHNILYKLSFDCVLRCSQVSRSLSWTTSDPSFISMHVAQPTTPHLLVIQKESLCHKIKEGDRFEYHMVLDFIYDGIRTVTTTTTFYIPYDFCFRLFGSYNGFLLFKSVANSLCYINNPITEEKVIISASYFLYELCALYFHTPTSEYKILYYVQTAEEMYSCKFLVLSFNSKMTREICMSDDATWCRTPAVAVSRSLHWMATVGSSFCGLTNTLGSCSESILAFDTDTEKFTSFAHPGPLCDSTKKHLMMQLLDMEGHLCLCVTPHDYSEICVWIIEDYRNKTWMKKYTLNTILVSPKDKISRHLFRNSSFFFTIKALRICKGKLLFVRGLSKLYSCDLETNTFELLKETKESLIIGNHTNSLASLNPSHRGQCIVGRTIAETIIELKPSAGITIF